MKISNVFQLKINIMSSLVISNKIFKNHVRWFQISNSNNIIWNLTQHWSYTQQKYHSTWSTDLVGNYKMHWMLCCTPGKAIMFTKKWKCRDEFDSDNLTDACWLEWPKDGWIIVVSREPLQLVPNMAHATLHCALQTAMLFPPKTAHAFFVAESRQRSN